MQTVLLLGRRRRAWAAARRLNLAVIGVDANPSGCRETGEVAHLRCDWDADPDGWAELAERARRSSQIDAVLGLTERAVVPAARIRERLGLPGDGVEVALRATDKLLMKQAVVAAGIPCARFVAAEAGLLPAELVATLGLPLIFKGRTSSGGRQNQILRQESEVEAGLPPGWIAESFVAGTEMSLEALVVDGRTLFLNPTEYLVVRWANIVPAALPPTTWAALTNFHERVLRALGIRHAFVHLELFWTADGPVFGELAIRPPGGYLMDLIELAYGFDPWEIWLRASLGHEVGPLPTAQRVAGVWVLHPGAGIVESVGGADAVRACPGVLRLELRVQPGTAVPERIGAGQDVGHLLVTGADRDQVAARLRTAREQLVIQLVAGARG